MRVLVMGGTRFVGVYLCKVLMEKGHQVVIFNRGSKPEPVIGVEQIIGDRTDIAQLQAKLQPQYFDAIIDNTGRELSDTKPLVEIFQDRVNQFIYTSSAGVYLKSDQMPHFEGDPTDPKSRHLGKAETEQYLAEKQLPFTAIRPTYIYGPKNYNDLEAWFFDRIVRDRPIPIPGNGLHITQLGHVQDLAQAMVRVLGNERAIGQIYNVSGDRYVTFNGLAKACAEAAGKSPDDLKIVYYDPKKFDFGKRKSFPLRLQHFFADISKAKQELNWQPEFDLVSGLRHSFDYDYLRSGRDKTEIDFSVDEEILNSLNS